MNDRSYGSVICVAFDFCGTLADLRPTSVEILNTWLQAEHGQNFDAERLSSILLRCSQEMPYSSLSVRTEVDRRHYFVDFNARVLRLLEVPGADGESLYVHFKGHERHWVLKPGADAMLGVLRARGYRVVLASNFDATLGQLLTRSGTAALFDGLFVSGALGIEKPAPAFYRHIQQSIGCPAAEIAMIGDDLQLDVLPALAVGMRSIHLRPEAQNTRILGAVGSTAYLEIASLEDLLQVFPERIEPSVSIGAAGEGKTGAG